MIIRYDSMISTYEHDNFENIEPMTFDFDFCVRAKITKIGQIFWGIANSIVCSF